MSEFTNLQISGFISERIRELTDSWMSEFTDSRINGFIHERITESTQTKCAAPRRGPTGLWTPSLSLGTRPPSAGKAPDR
jgi:hypothetical protein